MGVAAPGLGPAGKPASRGDHGSRCQDHASPDRSQQTEQARENQSVPQAGESSTGGQQPECRKHAQEEQRPRAKLRVRGNGPRALGARLIVTGSSVKPDVKPMRNVGSPSDRIRSGSTGSGGDPAVAAGDREPSPRL